MDLDEKDLEAVRKRLVRAQGQLGGIVRMIEDGRDCTDVLTQLAAANAAISRAGFQLISSSLAACAMDETGEQDRKKLEKAFLSLS
jgi:Uncharacterized protein conserved in bacteria